MGRKKAQTRAQVLVIDDGAIRPAVAHGLADVQSRLARAAELSAPRAEVWRNAAVASVAPTDFDAANCADNAQGNAPLIVFIDLDVGGDAFNALVSLTKQNADIPIVACTSSSGQAWTDVIERVGLTDRLVLASSPLEASQAAQFIFALSRRGKASHAEAAAAQQTSSDDELRRAHKLVRHLQEKLELETRRRQAVEQQLSHSASHDVLTDLPNRALLLDRIEQCIRRARRFPEYMFAVLSVDLDDFKIINDSLGHSAGDELLVEFSDRVQSCLRGMDTAARPSEETTARLGGDEFVIVLDGIKEAENAEVVASRIQAALAHPLHLHGHDVVTTASIGIVCSDPNYEKAEDILRDADTALYQAKSRGKGRYQLFSAALRHRAVARLQLENDLRKAIERDELRLHFQPIVSLLNGAAESLEVLLRWQHSEQGMIQPGDFIPIAEETGLIVPIGYWVIREACQQGRLWHEMFRDRPPFSLSVNLSLRQFSQEDLIERVDQIIEQTGYDPTRLNLEVTESLIMSSAESTAHTLRRFKDRRFGLHIDDFGTGYSSLSYLHALPMDAIKIDRSFVSNMKLDGEHAATIQAVVTLAHNRGMKVVAEGIETAEQLVQLQALECDLGQGYYFAKPTDARTVEQSLRAGQRWLKSA